MNPEKTYVGQSKRPICLGIQKNGNNMLNEKYHNAISNHLTSFYNGYTIHIKQDNIKTSH